MTETVAMAERVALFSSDGRAWSDGTPVVWQRNDRVAKIIIGSLQPSDEANRDSDGIEVSLPESFADLFPRLTHLYLWGMQKVETIPELPAGLQCLDVRNCGRLATLPELPSDLETLVLERSPILNAPGRTMFEQLADLSIQGCGTVREAWLHAVLRQSPRLRWLNASGCAQVTRIPAWSDQLVDIRLDDCVNLTSLPRRWPRQLRRLGLRGAESVTQLPDFVPSLDYVDLARTRSLRALPRERGTPRTLFLYGSGLLVPPASEHGATDDENVAPATAAYFADVALTGEGDVKRCKLLVLGNGGAGKTCLSLSLVGRDPAEALALGSTHGIQFWDWSGFDANVDHSMEPVDLHVWDFGGQEIYHNTHQLFVNKGAVFIVVWHPDQDGRQPLSSGTGYMDEWRPLQYWIDFIHLSCSHKPRIAIVCSHHARATAALERQRLDQLRSECHEYQCFYVDSDPHRRDPRAGDRARPDADHEADTGREGLVKWLQDEVGAVIHTQGRAVPTYWEIAQDMVEGWVSATQHSSATTHTHMEMPEFANHLSGAIADRVNRDTSGRFHQLGHALRSGTFEITDDRIRRTLGFLTHSGWVYWDPNLFQSRVIVGQKWALDGLYALLERRPSSSVFNELTRSDGRFTISDLGRYVWDAMGFSRAEQELLCSYMAQCGLCFRLRDADEAWSDEAVYVSFEHLPTVHHARLANEFRRRGGGDPPAVETIESATLHKLHWQRLLIDAGATYGKNAEYAEDGLLVRNAEGQDILVLFDADPGGLGGRIRIEVQGPYRQGRRDELVSHVRTFLPGSTGARSDSAKAIGESVDHERVFISYAWNPSDDPSADYEEPVERIVAFLSQPRPTQRASRSPMARGGRTPVRDRAFMRSGDDIAAFMRFGARCPYVIVVHSDKYWRSPDCMYELVQIDRDLREQPDKSRKLNVIPVRHPSSRITSSRGLAEYLAHWSGSLDIPARIPDPKALPDSVRATLRAWAEDLSKDLNYDVPWRDPKQQALEEIARRLSFSPG